MAAIHHRTTHVLLVLVLLALLALIGMMAVRSDAGPLDPPFAPNSTGRTIEDVYDAWHRRLPASDGSAGGDFLPPPGCNSTRFKCVMEHGSISFRQYPVVLDLETGLVWERIPATSTTNWLGAMNTCRTKQLAFRSGWRLPSNEEFNSLRDTTSSNTNQMPVGHPFQNFDSTYWTSTTYGGSLENYAPSYAYVSGNFPVSKSDPTYRVWCVRGGAGTEEVMTP